MALYFVSYDLRKQRNYQPLSDALTALGGKRSLESVWHLQHPNTTADNLRQHLARFIDSDDGLLVIQASAWSGQRLLNSPPANWT